MARGLRWTIPFMSHNNVACRIEIYNEGWTGDSTELSLNNPNAPGVAGDDPFFYEEGNNDNLLDVIRVKTGYINLMETTTNGLTDLIPTTDTENYIKFYYGSELNFTGYMQTFNPSMNWEPAPRKFKIPVQSPLGLIDSLRIDFPSTPGASSIGVYLARILAILNANYTGIVMPDISTDVTAKIHSMLIDSWNDAYNYDINDNQSPIIHGTLKTILEGICNMCGWILHDTPTELVFSSFDYTGKYSFWTSTNLYSGTGQTQMVASVPQINLLDYFENVLKGSKEKYVGTLSKLTIDYGESSESEELELKRVKYIDIEGGGDLLKGNSVEFNRFSETSDLSSSGAPTASTQPLQAWIYGIYNGDSGETTEKLIFYTGNNSANNGKVIFRVRIYTHWLYKLSGRLSWGPDTRHLGHDGIDNDFYIYMSIDKTPGTTPDTDGGNRVAYVNHSTGEFTFYFGNYESMLNGACVELAVYYKTNFPGANRVFSLDEIKMEKAEVYGINKYTDTMPQYKNIMLDSGSREEASLSLLFNQRKKTNYNNDEHRLLGNFLDVDYEPDYAYLGKNQHRLELKIKRKNYTYLTYIAHWLYFNRAYRIIAVKFYPRDDEYELIMHYPMN